jgi:hypothetical protein
MEGSQKFRYGICPAVELCRANEQVSRCNQREKKALVIRLFVLFVTCVILESLAEPIV